MGRVVSPQNSAISPPSLAAILAFGGAVYPLRSDYLSHLILSLGSSPETQAPKPVLPTTSVPNPGDHMEMNGSPPHHLGDLGHYLRLSQAQVGSGTYVLSALRSSKMAMEGGSIAYPPWDSKHRKGAEPRYLRTT